ncbi:MAG: DUF4352 domain-containing protein [Anaerolineae bacterium]
MSESAPAPEKENPQPEPAASSVKPAGPPRRRCLVIIPIVGGIFLLMVVAALILFLGLQRLFHTGETGAGMPLEVTKLAPTPFASPLPPPSCETIISSGDVQVAVSFPISLGVGSESFPVVAVAPEQGGWTYPQDYPGSAVWICGTVVNYVVGLEPLPANEALLAGLRPGDEIKLYLSNGAVLLFRFVEGRETTANEAGVFEQFRPRLTLILESGADTWQVATADYVAETEPVQPPPSGGALAQPGQPVRVGGAQVTVIEGYAERSGPALLAGTMYYLVEFSVENVGAVSLDANAFNVQLQDGVGNRYLLSPEASAAGEHGPLSGEIEPGATVQGTAGYLVPEALAGPTLVWSFSPQPGSELRASVSIPYEGEAGLVSRGQADVEITDAFLDGGGDVLIIEGEVWNRGSGPLTVELSDISLTSSAGMSALRSAAPPLPWTVQPGETQIIELQYEKPDAPTALLALLGYSFEIGGLP